MTLPTFARLPGRDVWAYVALSKFLTGPRTGEDARAYTDSVVTRSYTPFW